MLNLFEKTSDDLPTYVSLHVKTGDAASEIFIFDSSLNLVDKGAGEAFTAKLPTGIYKIRVRNGSRISERTADLLDTKKIKTVEFEPLAFVSPVPLEGTAQTHKYHIDEARRHSALPTAHVGSGSSIFIFARLWTQKNPDPSQQTPNFNPTRGLRLIDEKGALVVDLEHVSVVSNSGHDPSAACNISVEAGFYRLRLELPDGSCIEQTIIAMAGWCTQVFLLQRDYGEAGAEELRSDLNGAAILMQKIGVQFDPSKPTLRFDEQARLAFTNQRIGLSESLEKKLLHAKFENPMLGLYVAYLILSQPSPNLATVGTVVAKLRKIFAPDRHPDVEALALTIPAAAAGPSEVYEFALPPMFRRSWATVVAKTVDFPGLVPEGSFAASISTRIWGSDPFLIWKDPSRASNKETTTSRLANLSEALVERHIEYSQKYSLPTFDNQQSESEWRTSFERQELSRAADSAKSNLTGELSEEVAERSEIDTKELVTGIVEALGIPYASAENLLKKTGHL